MDPFIGEIRIFAGSYTPEGWALCDGSLKQISDPQYTTLYSLIGITYGGNGSTNFALPDLRGRIPVHQGQGAGLTARAMGQAFGSEAVTITSGQINHNHPLQGSLNAATTNNPSGNVYATTSAKFYDTPGDEPAKVKPFSPNAVLGTTGGLPHENRMPYLTVNYIICLKGFYPERS